MQESDLYMSWCYFLVKIQFPVTVAKESKYYFRKSYFRAVQILWTPKVYKAVWVPDYLAI